MRRKKIVCEIGCTLRTVRGENHFPSGTCPCRCHYDCRGNHSRGFYVRGNHGCRGCTEENAQYMREYRARKGTKA